MLKSGVALALALDHPNERSLHTRPLPRTGGLAIHIGLVVAWLSLSPVFDTLAGLVLFLAIGSFLDDRWGLPVLLRLAVHSLAAVLLGRVVAWELSAMAQVAVVLGAVWMTNLYNFMDGSDGLAGGMTLFGFSFLGIAAWLSGDVEFSILNFSIAATAAAFLVFNFHPARVFLGDAGSIPLGFLSAAAGTWGWYKGYWFATFPLLIFSAFIGDATITLVRRMLRGERFWQAHRDHYYQKLVQMGWGHRTTAIVEYAIMIVSGVVALAAMRLDPIVQASLTMGWFALLLVLMMAVDARWRHFGVHDAES
jgi:UDP-N-acetylmuramyl pentapeptide phosphotransferase/UDP-N-acetylglucosamine-1-phosphate transferase